DSRSGVCDACAEGCAGGRHRCDRGPGGQRRVGRLMTISSPPRDAQAHEGGWSNSDDEVFGLHRGGKLTTAACVPEMDERTLSMAYTPGVARVCTAIADDPAVADDFTWVRNTVAVVTDGTAVLGLG